MYYNHGGCGIYQSKISKEWKISSRNYNELWKKNINVAIAVYLHWIVYLVCSILIQALLNQGIDFSADNHFQLVNCWQVKLLTCVVNLLQKKVLHLSNVLKQNKFSNLTLVKYTKFLKYHNFFIALHIKYLAASE